MRKGVGSVVLAAAVLAAAMPAIATAARWCVKDPSCPPGGGHRLHPGTYRLEAVPRNAAGAGRAVRATFVVKK